MGPKNCGTVEGKGIYRSAQGDSYSSNWQNNNLPFDEKSYIKYPDGSKYEGHLNNWMYTGKGMYTFPDGSSMECNFEQNCPTGEIVLRDPNGHLWKGKADLGYGWMEPTNHYYNILVKQREQDEGMKEKMNQSNREQQADSKLGSQIQEIAWASTPCLARAAKYDWLLRQLAIASERHFSNRWEWSIFIRNIINEYNSDDISKDIISLFENTFPLVPTRCEVFGRVQTARFRVRVTKPRVLRTQGPYVA
ncbi:hypothetical protein EVAR_19162_1 [Eumeta japonica]|uniref:MORN repeat-containing protein 5 n=1 Tax=Eumeta variegata TaxID=151549 RepID=A0A4C1VQ90_EUMVA|nr:hypothetical protein EVAR_19162_1 [Eumeta japonica]